MKNTVSGQHSVSLALALMMVVSSVGIIMTGDATGGDQASAYYRIDVGGAADVDALRSAGVEIVEDYGVFAIVKMPASLKTALGKSHNIEQFTDATLVKFNGYEFDVTKGEPAFPSDLILTKQQDYSGFYLVKFLGPIKTSWTDGMERIGAKNYGPAGPSTFLVGMTAAQKAQVASLPHVLWVGDYQPAYKVSDMFSGATGKQTVNVLTYPELQGSAKGRIGRLFQQTGRGAFFDDYAIPDTVSNGTTGYIRAVVDASIIPEIAKIAGVQYIEKYEQPKPTNALQHGQVQTGTSTSIGAPATLVAGSYGAAVTVWNNGIFGQNMVLGSSDSGIRIDHLQFYQAPFTNANWDTGNGHAEGDYNFSVTTHRKIIRYAIAEQNGWDKIANAAPDHGTHMTCTAAGYDNPAGGTSVNDGVAPGEKISFYDIGGTDATAVFPPREYSAMWDLARTDGARVYTMPWGSSYQTSYTANMQKFDQYMYDNPTMLLVSGAGSEGTAAYTLSQQAESKNLLSVGAYIDGANSMTIATFSSNGPTYDGRLKPDIMAPGTATTSANSAGTTGYIDFDGVSSSCSNIAGAALLLNQYFLDGYYPTGAEIAANTFNPSAALIKALFANGCEQMTGAVRAYNNGNGAGAMNYPNCAQGWGRVDLDNSLYFPGDALKLLVVDADNGVETGDFIEYKYRLTDATQNFKTTLCWSDYPGVIGTGAALVNDLDLLVTSPTGVQYKGNIFTGALGSAYTPGNSAFAYDHRNNVEEVWVRAADTSVGEWKVRVTGYNVPKAVQPFGLVMTGSLDRDYGTIQFDKDIYGVNHMATIRIEDNGAGAGPLPVVVSSAIAGKTETVSCSLVGTGVYVGTVGFTLNCQDPAGNGILPVTATDSVSARYDDVSGTVHSAWANATIDGYGPTITNVHTGLISMSTAEILWTTSEQANATVYYGTNPASLTGVAKAGSPYTTSQYVLVTGLAINTLYYYDVESTDVHGNKIRATNGGSHFTFTTQLRGDILLYINGGTGYDYNLMINMYKWAFDNKGWTYNVMTSWNDGTPSLATLQLYKLFVFQPGQEQYPQFSASQRTLVKQYMDAGGRFFTTSQDAMWALGSAGTGYSSAATISWCASQLHSTWVVDPVTMTNIVGIAGDPISGAYTGGVPPGVTYNAFRSGGYADEITSVTAGHTVTYVWRDSGGAATPGYIAVKSISTTNNGTAGVGTWGGTPSRMVNYAFEWSCIVDNFTVAAQTRADILDLTVRFLIGNDHPDVTVSSPNGGETLAGPTTTVTWTRTTYGGATVANQTLYYSPNSGASWYLAAQTPTIPTAATSYVWDISGLPKGSQYLVKMAVADGGITSPFSPPLTGSDQSNAVFTISTIDGQGPLAWPGSVRVSPNPIDSTTTVWINATIDDGATGNSNVAAAEYFIDSIGASGAGTAMSASDGSFNSPAEMVRRVGTLALTLGTHKAYVHGRDSVGNWGAFENASFYFQGASVAPTPWFNITVVAGWNFISFPTILQNETLPTALLDKTPGVVWSRAMWYNPQMPADPWKQYNTVWNAALNDLKTVDHTIGVWLYVTTVGDGVLTLGGSGSREAGDTLVSLTAGWNMIGFPSQPMTVAQFKSLTSATIVEGYNGSTTYGTSALADGATMLAGRAYWVKVPANVVWNAHYGAPTPYMRFSKTAPTTANVGDTITYTLTYSNIGNTASNVVVTEIYPVGVTFVSSMPAPSMGNNVWNIGSVSSGASGAITITVTVLVGTTTLANVATLDYTDSGAAPMPTRQASATTAVGGGGPILAVTKTGPVVASPGQMITYTITVSNIGTDTAFNGWINETYPVEFTYISSNPSPTIPNDRWNFGAIPPGSWLSVNVTVMVNMGVTGNITNHVTVDYLDSLGVSMPQVQASAVTRIAPELLMASKLGPLTANTGETIMYTIYVTNVGTTTALSTWVNDTYPSGVTFINSNPAPAIGVGTWLFPVIMAGNTVTIFINVTVTASSGTLVNNVLLEYLDSMGLQMPDVAASCATTVVNPLLTLTKVAPATALPGDIILYTMSVMNVGTDWAYNVMITEFYPAPVTYLSSTILPTIGNNIWLIPAMSPGTSYVLTVTVQISPTFSGTMTNTVSVDYENLAGMPVRIWANATTLVLAHQPTSQANVISPYWRNASPATFTANATDCTFVSLFYRYSANNATWGAWTLFGNDSTAPWSWSFAFPSGNGYYEFYTTGHNGTSHEAAPVNADTRCGYDTVAPSSNAVTSSYWRNSPVTITATASATLAPIAFVALYCCYSTNNVTWGVWILAGTDSTSPYSFLFNFSLGQGYYRFFTMAQDAAGNLETAPGTPDVGFGYDSVAPISACDVVGAFWRSTTPITITVTASDAMSGVASVSLYARYGAVNGTFGAYSLIATDTTVPYQWSYSFPSGQGFYEFYTRASDRVPNTEVAPAVCDVRYGYDITAPVSSVNAISPYNIVMTPLSVVATASDSYSGIANVELYYRFSTDNATWGAWALFGTDTTSPFSWSFTFPSGIGFYKFYSIAKDWATMVETAPATWDTGCYYGVIGAPPGSQVSPISPYWRNSLPIILNATGTNCTSVTLWYRFSSDNATWGSWTNFGDDTAAPWSWTISGASNGYRQFYSIGHNGTTNEAAPAAADARFCYDTALPVRSSGFPAADGRTGDTSPEISVRVTDALSGIRASTILLYVGGFSVFYNAVAIANGYNVSYQYGGNYPDGTVVGCRIVARDMAGNLVDYSWSFTVDTAPPTVTATIPTGGATGVWRSEQIRVTFSEAVVHASAEFAFYITPLTAGSFSWLNNTMILTPTVPLAGLTQYNVTIWNTVADLADNDMTSPYTFSFITESGVDVTPPQHSQETPAPNGTATNTTPVISVDVTDSSGVNVSSIHLYVQGYTVFFERETITGGYRVKYWHEAGFASGTVVTCRIVARDTVGNLLDYTWIFTVP